MRPMKPVLSWEPEPQDLCPIRENGTSHSLRAADETGENVYGEPPRCGLGWAARLFGKTQDWVKAEAEAGRLPGRKVDGQWQFTPMEVRAYVLRG